MMSSLQMSDATALQPHPKVVWLIHSKLNKNENPAFHFIYSFTIIFFAHKALCDATVPYSTRISFFLFRCIMYSLA